MALLHKSSHLVSLGMKSCRNRLFNNIQCIQHTNQLINNYDHYNISKYYAGGLNPTKNKKNRDTFLKDKRKEKEEKLRKFVEESDYQMPTEKERAQMKKEAKKNKGKY